MMTSRPSRLRAVVSAFLLVVMSATAHAQSDLPMDLQVPLFLRVLTYDRALNRNGGGELVIAVLYDAGNAASNTARTSFVRAVRGGRVSSVAGRSIKVVEINAAAGQVDASLKQHRAAAAYVAPGLDARLREIVSAATANKVTLLSGSASHARRGVAVAVGEQGGKPKLFINLPAARSAGADLPAPLLNIAEVIQ